VRPKGYTYSCEIRVKQGVVIETTSTGIKGKDMAMDTNSPITTHKLIFYAFAKVKKQSKAGSTIKINQELRMRTKCNMHSKLV